MCRVLLESKKLRLIEIQFSDGLLYEVHERKGNGKGVSYILTKDRKEAYKRYKDIKIELMLEEQKGKNLWKTL